MNKFIGPFPVNPLTHAMRTAWYRGTSKSWKAFLFSGLAGGMSVADAVELGALDGLNGFAIEGMATNEQLGKSVNGAGDVNGDGIDDVILYARGADPAFGRAYVVFGRDTEASANFTPRFDLTLLTADLTNLNTSFGFIIDGINGDNAARSVSSAGDINGDGIDDLIVGSAENSLGANNLPLMGTGKAYVIYGRPTAQTGFFPNTINLRQLTVDQGFILNGIVAGDQAGSAVAGAGDVNGDGIDDVVVGARFADAEGRRDAGESYVVFGRNAAVDGGFPLNVQLSNLDGTNGFTLSGADLDDLSGHAVEGAGDINGDGIDDVIIGAYLADNAVASDAGAAYIVFGRNTALTGNFPVRLDLASIDGAGGFALEGQSESDQLGRSIAGIGDINADGIDDILIGARLANPNGVIDAGESYVIFGRNTSVNGPFPSNLSLSSLNGVNGFAINGISQFDRLGHAVSGAGDVDGNGIADLLVTAPNANNNAGVTYIVFGRDVAVRGNFPSQINLASLNERNVRIVNGARGASTFAEGDFSGRAAGVLGDINGDGAADFIIGAPLADPLNRLDGGEAYVVFGSPLPPVTTITITAGNNQTLVAGQNSVPVEYQVFDINGNIVVGQPISLVAALPPNVATSDGVTVINGTTDMFGRVSASLDARMIAGQYTLTAGLPPLNQVFANASITVTAAAPDRLVAISGQGQILPADQASMAFVFRLADRFNNPVANNQVNFSLVGPGGSSALTPPAALTDVSGQVSTQLSSATVPGQYTVSGTLLSTPSVSDSVEIQVISGAPNMLSVVAGGEQTIAAGTPSANIQVQLTDAFANPVTNGETIRFGLALPDGMPATTGLSAFEAIVDDNGQAVTQLEAMSLAGSYAIFVVLASNDMVTTQTTVAVTPAAPAMLTLVGGADQIVPAGTPSTDISFQLADQFNNVIAGETLNFTLLGPDGQPIADGLSLPNGDTDAMGSTAIQTIATGVIGGYTATATLASDPALTSSASLTVVPGTPAALNLVIGGSQSIVTGQPSSPVIFQLQDAFGNLAPDQILNFSHMLPDGTAGAGLGVATAATDAMGQAATQLLNSAPTGVHTISATSALDNALVASAQIRVTDTTPDLPDLGTGAALDANGAPLITDARFGAGVSVNGGAFVNPAAFSVDDNVIVQGEFDVDSRHFGQSADIVAIAAHRTLAGTTEFLALNSSGQLQPWTGEVATLPTAIPGVTLFSPQSLSLFSGQLNLTGASDWFFGYRLADGTIVFSTTPLHMDIVAGMSAGLAVVAGDQQVLVAGDTSTPISFQLTDGFANPTSGLTVAFNVTLPDGSVVTDGLNVTEAVSNADGVVAAQLSVMQPAGIYQVNAVLMPGNTLSASATLTVSNAMPAEIRIIAGADQQIPAGQPSSAIHFQVVDMFGNPVANQALSFSETTTVAAVMPVAATSAADGQVITQLNAITVAGDYIVQAVLDGSALPASATRVRVLPLAPSVINLLGGNGQNVFAGTASMPISFNITDEFGNPVADTMVSFTLTPPGGAPDSTGLTPSSVQTSSSGQISVIMDATSTLGAHTLTTTLANAPSVTNVLQINVIEPPPPLINTGAATAIGAMGEPLTTSAQFSLGGSVNGGAFTSPVTLTTDDTLQVRALIDIDAMHVGQMGEFVSVFFHQPPVGPAQGFMLDAAGQLNPWDGNPASLIAFEPLQTLFTPVSLSLSNGPLNLVGQVSVFVGYRLADGILVFTPTPLQITVQTGVPTQLQLLAGDGQAITAGVDSAPLQFVVRDASGNPIAGQAVDFVLTPPVGAPTANGLTADQLLSDINGIVAVQLVAPIMVGNYLLDAQVAGVPALAVRANLSVTATTVTSLVLNSGANQLVPAGQDAMPVNFLLTDQFGNPAPGLEVSFNVRPPVGAVTTDGLTPVAATSDSDGEVAVVLNGAGLIGNYLIRATATASGLTDTVSGRCRSGSSGRPKYPGRGCADSARQCQFKSCDFARRR